MKNQKSKINNQKYNSNFKTNFLKFSGLNLFNFQQSIITSSRGFTIVEMLVVIAIIATVATMSTQIILSLIRSNNKTVIQNEVRQNGQFVVDLFERDVRAASDAQNTVLNDLTSIDLTQSDGSVITYSCAVKNAGTVSNGYIKKKIGSSASKDLLNTDTSNGVAVNSCSFAVNASNPVLVTVDFTLTQAISAPNRSDLTLSQPFHTSVSLRTY